MLDQHQLVKAPRKHLVLGTGELAEIFRRSGIPSTDIGCNTPLSPLEEIDIDVLWIFDPAGAPSGLSAPVRQQLSQQANIRTGTICLISPSGYPGQDLDRYREGPCPATLHCMVQPHLITRGPGEPPICSGLIGQFRQLMSEVERRVPGYWEGHPIPLGDKLVLHPFVVADLMEVLAELTSLPALPPSVSGLTSWESGTDLTFAAVLEAVTGRRYTFTAGDPDNALHRLMEELLNAFVPRIAQGAHHRRRSRMTFFPSEVAGFYKGDAASDQQTAGLLQDPMTRMQERHIRGPLSRPFRYLVGGEGAETLIIINALGLSISFWNESLKILMNTCRVIIWETRCGDLQKGGMAIAPTINDHVEDIMHIIEAEGRINCHLVAWCNGGRIALAAAAAAPEQIRSVVLVAPVFRGITGFAAEDTQYEKDLQEVFNSVLKNPKIAGLLSAYLVTNNKKKPDPAAGMAQILGYADAAFREPILAPMSTGDYLFNYAKRTEYDEQYPLHQLLEKISQPVTVILGSHDAVVSNSLVKQVCSVLKNCEIFMITGGSHYLQLQQPGLLCSVITDAIGKTILLTTDLRVQHLYTKGKRQDTGSLQFIYEYPAKNWPDKIAIRDGRTAFTFGQLWQGSISLARLLTSHGVKKGDRVLVVADKRAEMAVICGAIWMAGAVYVPIDPNNPPARDEYLFGSIKPRLVIAPDASHIKFNLPSPGFPIITYPEVITCTETVGETPVGFPAISGTDLAYIMHTSGSTGVPKGVMIGHGSVISYFHSHNLVLKFTQRSYCLSNAPFYFDVSIEDTILPLSVGAAVYQYRGLPIAELILNTLAKEGITHLIAVSTLLTLITGDGKKLRDTNLHQLEMVMTGAEVCDIKVINAWKEAVPWANIINVYGPTETTIVCTAYTILQPDPDRKEFYPIGKPLEGVHALLLGPDDNLIVTAGEPGELLIGGPQVMKGYWQNETLTAQVLTTHEGVVYYRTGDRCYRDEENNFIFCGRNDEEIKLYGRRINLLEIKAALLESEMVQRAAVGIIEKKGRKILASVIVPDAKADTDLLAALKSGLRNRLPAYMVPEYWGLLHDSPLAPTGKNDDKKMMTLLGDIVRDTPGEFFMLNTQHDFSPTE